MKLSESIKSISYLKAHTAEMVRDATANGTTYVITQNGEAKVIVQDIKEYEKMQERDALLQMLAMGTEDIIKGRYRSIKEVFRDLDKKIKKPKKDAV